MGINILILIVLIGGMLFMTTRTQKKQRDMRSSMMSKLKPGAEVVTIGRLHGIVESINEAEKTFTLDADGVYLVFDMDAIARVNEAPTKVVNPEVETSTEDINPKVATSDNETVIDSKITAEVKDEKITDK